MNSKSRPIATFVLLFWCFQLVHAQDGLMYYMRNVPHTYQLNPATAPTNKFFIGIPILSSISLNAGNNALAFNDIIQYDESTNTPVLPLYSDETKARFLSNFSQNNNLNFSGDINLGSVGFVVNDFAIAFDMNIKSNMRLNYPGDLMHFLLNGNPGGTNIDLSYLNINANSYLETGLNISKQFGDRLRIGIRPKLLNGIFNIHTRNNNSSLAIDVENIDLQAQVDAQIGLPELAGLDPFNEDGSLREDLDLSNVDYAPMSLIKSSFSNLGAGIDLGIHYQLLPNLELSASLVDLGFIRWNGLNHNRNVNGNIEFDGYDISNLDEEYFAEYIDSSINQIAFDYNNDPFTSSLSPKLFLGGHFQLLSWLDLGVVSKTTFNYKAIDEAITFFANLNAGKKFTFSTGYQVANNNYGVFSMGLSYRVLIFNGFIITETVPMQYDRVHFSNDAASRPIPVPVNVKRFNVRFGFNIAIGNYEE